MSRIAKSDVNAALSLAARIIVAAGGADGRISRAEVAAKLPALPAEQRALVDVFFKFIDHRDARPGAQVTRSDVDKAVAYAKESMIAKYDLNSNGLSAGEIARMSLTGKRAVDLARALKKAAVDDGPVAPPRMDEGLSEPDEILAAGQVPRDWTPEVSVTSGLIRHTGTTFDGFETSLSLTAEQREVTDAAMKLLWDRHLQYRADGAGSLPLTADTQGTLKVGAFTRSDDGKTYLVADWRDIDDGSYTLYFERLASGKLRLAIDQFNN
jgi:hypothetical protein